MTTSGGSVLAVAALEALSADQRGAYEAVVSGLERLEAALPATCTPETQAALGETIKRAKAAEKFVDSTLAEITAPHTQALALQRALWNPLAARAKAIVVKAAGLVEDLLNAEKRRREEEERQARALVAQKQREQAEAEAKALAAETPEAAAAAARVADAAWNETKAAVAAASRGPATTSVKVGGAVVFESQNLDYEITNMGEFATAHPELVEELRGRTLKALRDAVSGYTSMPETVPGFPGVRLKLKTATRTRSK